jgi:dTDP-4-dehydrorhamnose reductase
VLGSTGMLGSMVSAWLERGTSCSVLRFARSPERDNKPCGRFDAEMFLCDPQSTGAALAGCDFIINCIGVIKPWCRDNDLLGVRRAIAVNALFPHALANFAKDLGAGVIQIATDCVYSGVDGPYDEDSQHDPFDVYGKSKSLGEVFDSSVLNIRCSIIGPERHGKTSLLEWFLNQAPDSVVPGYAHHHWNGVTTLQFAQLCEQLVVTDGLQKSIIQETPLFHFVPNPAVSKFELLNIFSCVYNSPCRVERVEAPGPPINRVLKTNFPQLSALQPAKTMHQAVQELRAFTEAHSGGGLRE